MNRPQKRNFIAVLPDGSEHPFDCMPDLNAFTPSLRQAVGDALYKANIRAKRQSLEYLGVKVYELTIEQGVIKRVGGWNISVHLHPERMTDAEYVDEQAALLQDIPVEFHGALSYAAYARGHSSGHEEVLGCLDVLVDMLKEPIKLYTTRIVGEALAYPRKVPTDAQV